VPRKKTIGGHGAATLRAFDHKRGFDDQGQRGVIVAWVAVSNVADNAAAVAHLWVCNQLGSFA